MLQCSSRWLRRPPALGGCKPAPFPLFQFYKHKQRQKQHSPCFNTRQKQFRYLFYRNLSLTSSIFLLYLLALLATTPITPPTTRRALVDAQLTSDLLQYNNRAHSGRFTVAQLCPGRSQFPVTKKVEGAMLSAETDMDMNCTITFKTKATHQHFVIRFEDLRLGCDDHLILFDNDLDYGQPSIKDFSCRDSLASTPFIKTTGSFLTLRYSSDQARSRRGNGFRLVLTAAFESSMWECPADYAVCRNKLCISRSLYCDDINHCLDSSDETNCSKGGSFADELSISNAVVIIVILVLIVFAFVVIILLTIYCRREDDHYSRYQHQLQRMIVPMHPSSSVMFNQYQYMPAPANMSPYMNMPRMAHGYSTLPINLGRQIGNSNKSIAQQQHPPQISPLNGPYVMMAAGVPGQPLPIMMPGNPQELHNPKYQGKHSQAYNLVLMGPGTNTQQPSQQQIFDSHT